MSATLILRNKVFLFHTSVDVTNTAAGGIFNDSQSHSICNASCIHHYCWTNCPSYSFIAGVLSVQNTKLSSWLKSANNYLVHSQLKTIPIISFKVIKLFRVSSNKPVVTSISYKVCFLISCSSNFIYMLMFLLQLYLNRMLTETQITSTLHFPGGLFKVSLLRHA